MHGSYGLDGNGMQTFSLEEKRRGIKKYNNKIKLRDQL